MPRKHPKTHVELIEDALVEYTDNKDFLISRVEPTEESRKTFAIYLTIDDKIAEEKNLLGRIRGYDNRPIPNLILCERYLEKMKDRVLASLRRFGYVEYKSRVSTMSLSIWVIYAKGSQKYKL